MMNKSKFHKLLEDAVSNDSALVSVIARIMPMINKLSKTNNKEIDDSDFYEDMHYLYANKAYDVLLNTFGNI